jgi:hypothetical protein
MAKRTTSVTVKMTDEDLKQLLRAAETIWPTILTRSSVVLGLAKIGADHALSTARKVHK